MQLKIEKIFNFSGKKIAKFSIFYNYVQAYL